MAVWKKGRGLGVGGGLVGHSTTKIYLSASTPKNQRVIVGDGERERKKGIDSEGVRVRGEKGGQLWLSALFHLAELGQDRTVGRVRRRRKDSGHRWMLDADSNASGSWRTGRRIGGGASSSSDGSSSSI